MGYVDFHAHVLPAADHGSDCLETSLAQLKMAVDAGVSDIFATPHFYVNADTVESFIERRERAFDLLQNAVIQQNIPIKLQILHFIRCHASELDICLETAGNSKCIRIQHRIGILHMIQL